jgi:hypothetical protein
VRRLSALISLVTLLALASLAPASGNPTFGTPVKMPGTSLGFEPGIDILNDGSIIVNEPQGLPGRTLMWRSTNGGANWTASTIGVGTNRFPGGGDGDIAVGHDGRVYMADLYLASSSVFISSDNGATFPIGHPIAQFPGDRQWLAVGPETPLGDTVYITANMFGTVAIGTSLNSGLTWSWLPQNGSGQPGQLLADDTGFVGYPILQGGGVGFWRSTNGVVFTSGPLVTTEVSETMIAAAMDGNDIYLVWTKNDWTIRLAHSPDKGLTWDAPITISTGGSNIFPWVAARNGKVAVAWYGSATEGTPDTNPGPWHLKYSEKPASSSTFTTPVNAWANPAKNGVICTNGLGCGLSNPDRALGDFLQLAIDANGKTLISFGSHAVAPKGALVIKQS